MRCAAGQQDFEQVGPFEPEQDDYEQDDLQQQPAGAAAGSGSSWLATTDSWAVHFFRYVQGRARWWGLAQHAHSGHCCILYSNLPCFKLARLPINPSKPTLLPSAPIPTSTNPQGHWCHPLLSVSRYEAAPEGASTHSARRLGRAAPADLPHTRLCVAPNGTGAGGRGWRHTAGAWEPISVPVAG